MEVINRNVQCSPISPVGFSTARSLEKSELVQVSGGVQKTWSASGSADSSGNYGLDAGWDW